MPIANGSLGNCYRLTIDGKLIGYFRTEAKAEVYWKSFKEYAQYSNISYAIDKWFIEGEF